MGERWGRVAVVRIRVRVNLSSSSSSFVNRLTLPDNCLANDSVFIIRANYLATYRLSLSGSNRPRLRIRVWHKPRLKFRCCERAKIIFSILDECRDIVKKSSPRHEPLTSNELPMIISMRLFGQFSDRFPASSSFRALTIESHWFKRGKRAIDDSITISCHIATRMKLLVERFAIFNSNWIQLKLKIFVPFPFQIHSSLKIRLQMDSAKL